jgi:NADP-dependent 3-hydroxy acid dehydrogenase YdfG
MLSQRANRRERFGTLVADDPPVVARAVAQHSAARRYVDVMLNNAGLIQEVKPYDIRTTVISPGAVDTELPNSVKAEGVSGQISDYYEQNAIPADSFARCVLFAISQPDDVDVNEILFRPTKQEL